MNRLPHYDKSTQRFEQVIFLGLSLASLALIALTLSDATRFARNRSDIVRSLTRPGTPVFATTTNDPASTNLTKAQGAPAESTRLNTFPVPKS